ncbi:hypothetical protein IV500_04245 [Paeniglutamicibacter antarcticus]|uniref:Uncharacterized protein n=1 Tax=Arthrobacter terrae TaxID=2935737 RepID=A0A931CPI1_9MICC|nr:hypothetical protein [Arthrobacter terrae]MBG0738631.1 hypothetical protein [Arthrobacter terrae]
MTVIKAFANVPMDATVASLKTGPTEIYRHQRTAAEAVPKDHRTVHVTLDVPSDLQFVIKRPAATDIPQFRIDTFVDAATIAIGAGTRVGFIHVVIPSGKKNPEEAQPLATYITAFSFLEDRLAA